MKIKKTFICGECGGRSPVWQGQCPRCRAWNTLKEETVAARAPLTRTQVAATRLEDVDDADHAALPTGLDALDEVLGRGLVQGGATLLGGEPGVGKSTLLLQLAGRLAAMGRRTLYVSGEESLPQLKSRAARLDLLGPGLLALSTTRCDEALAVLERETPDLLIVDSVQTLTSAQAEGGAGGVSQVRAVAAELVEAVKKGKTSLILVGHVTKEGAIAGPKLLEHMVDAVLYLEGDRRHAFRILRAFKNRFGPADELVVFQMGERGLEPAPDPSTFFLEARDAALSGSALVMAVDGRRPFAVEAQALATKSWLPSPRRTALGFDVNRLHLLLAVLEKRLRLNFGQFDVYAKIGGGLRMQDPGLDLGLAAAVLSSYYDAALPEGAVFWGEIDLNGRIRPAAGHDVRLKQARRLGYGPIFSAGQDGGKSSCNSLTDLQAKLFGASGPGR